MAPIDINNQEISSITLNGNTEIDTVEVNGQTVFSAGPSLPVAYSNLVLWYPFDSATYGGANADDVTAIIGGSGDDTAYNGAVGGASYQSSGGVTDIDAGANSGAYNFDGSDYINISSATSLLNSYPFSVCIWNKFDDLNERQHIIDRGAGRFIFGTNSFVNGVFGFRTFHSDGVAELTGPSIDTNYHHLCVTLDTSGNFIAYVDGVNVDSQTGLGSHNNSFNGDFDLGRSGYYTRSYLDGQTDDFRIYNKALSSSEVNQIYQNTEP